MAIREKHLFITSDGKEFTSSQEAENHEITLNNKKLLRLEKYMNGKHEYKYPLNMEGIWEVRGEDPNPDMGGAHYEPLIGRFSGKFKDVLEYAVMQEKWGTWVGYGSVKRLEVIPIERVK